jgi:tetrahydrodipicolinate N-succinyltransferase
LQQQIANLQKQLAPKSASPKTDTESEAKKKIQTALDKFNSLKIEKISDEGVEDWLDTFEEMENWIVTGNEEEIEASMNKQSELKEIVNKLELEDCRRE